MRNAVTYTREMREFAKEQGKHLITISIPGFEVQAPVSDEVRNAVSRFMSSLIKSRPGPPPDFETQADELWSALDVLCDEVADSNREFDFSEGQVAITAHRIAEAIEDARKTLIKHGRDNTQQRTKNQEPPTASKS